MSLDPQARKFLDDAAAAGAPPVHECSVETARQQMIDSSRGLGDVIQVESIEDRRIPGPGGEIPVRIYRPSAGPLPVIVYFHGGGWVVGNIETHDGYCRALADASRSIVVSVDYRLAPEHRYPVAAEDCYAATVWASENADSLGGSAERLIVAGDSAGGNLAAAVALMTRDRNGPAIAYQVLIYPITDHDFEAASYRECESGYHLSRDAMIWFWDHYCPETDRRNEPYASPLRCDDLAGLPPTLVMTAGFDPLCSEGDAYALRLREAGVATRLSRYDGMIHGFTRRFHLFDRAHDALREIAAAVNGLRD